MKCPKCVGTLTPVYVGSVELDRCYVCEGLWFDPGEIETVIEKYSADLKNIMLDSRLFDGKDIHHSAGSGLDEKRGDCPKCSNKMFFRQYGDVKADACPQGHGIWLDGGEIYSLKKIEEKTYFGLLKYILSFAPLKGRNIQK